MTEPATERPSAGAAGRIRGLFSPPDTARRKEERRADRFAAWMLLAAAGVNLLLALLALPGLLPQERRTLFAFLLPATLLLAVPAAACLLSRGEGRSMKAWLLAAALLALTLEGVVLPRYAVLALAFPVLLSVCYRSVELTACTGVLSAALLLVSSWLSVRLRLGPADLNLVELPAGTALESLAPVSLRVLVLSGAALDARQLWRQALVRSVLPSLLLLGVISFVCTMIARQGRTAAAESKHSENLAEELELARRIQQDMVPNVYPAFPDRREFDVYAKTEPAKELGGDFYDFQMLDSDHLALIIADVAGKGIPAALFMMALKIVIHSMAKSGTHDPAKILRSVNRQIEANNSSDMFVTLWLGVLEISTGKLRAANAGHEYPCIRRFGSGYRLLKDPHGLVLGAVNETEYRSYELDLKPGDAVFVYTDGVTEAADPDEELFGDERLTAALNTDPDAEPEQLLVNVREAIRLFVREAPASDDITMLALKYYGYPGKPDSADGES